MPKESQEKMVRTSVTLPQKKRDLLGKIADANGSSVAWIIRCAVDEFLESNKKNKKLKIKSVEE